MSRRRGNGMTGRAVAPASPTVQRQYGDMLPARHRPADGEWEAELLDRPLATGRELRRLALEERAGKLRRS